MNQTIKKFTFRLILLTILIGILSGIFAYLAPSSFVSPALPYMILLFFIVTFVVYFILSKSGQNKFSRFTSNFMLATFLKLLLYLIVVIGYTFFNKKDAVQFIISFFILYLIYTIYEVISLLNFRYPEQQ